MSALLLSLLIVAATLTGVLPSLFGRRLTARLLPVVRGLSLGAILVLVAGHLAPEAWHMYGAALWPAVAGWLLLLALLERLGGHRHTHIREASWAQKIGRESLWIALYVHAMADGAAFAAVAQGTVFFGGLGILILHRVAVSLAVVSEHTGQQLLRLLLLAAITVVTANGLLFAVGAGDSLFWSSLLIATLTHLGNHTYVAHRTRDARTGRLEAIGLVLAVLATLPIVALPPHGWFVTTTITLTAYLLLVAVQQRAKVPFRCHDCHTPAIGSRLPFFFFLLLSSFYAPLALPVAALLFFAIRHNDPREHHHQDSLREHLLAELPWLFLGLWTAWLLLLRAPDAFSLPLELAVLALLLILDLPWSFWLPIWLTPVALPVNWLLAATVLGSSTDGGFLSRLPRRRLLPGILAPGLLAAAFFLLAGRGGSLPLSKVWLNRLPEVPLLWMIAAAAEGAGLLMFLYPLLRQRGPASLLASLSDLTGMEGHAHHGDTHSPEQAEGM